MKKDTMVLKKQVDLPKEVFNAAKDGHIQQLKQFLENKPPDEVQKVVAAKTRGATPLIMACRNGHLAVVDYVLEKCSADIEQVGTVSFDGENIEGAPPLWCAAAAGHYDIVKLLIKKGAKVNNTTFTNSTPLRAACFDGHFEIVKYLVDNKADIEIANRHGHTCLMIACYKGHTKIVKYLMDKGAKINRKSLKGNTALHDCAESGSLGIMKVLLNHNAVMEKDSYGMTPLLAAAVTGHTKIVEYIIGRDDCQKKQKIDALELLGATYVDKKRDMMGAMNIWKQAMQERNHANIHKPQGIAPHAAYEHAVEAKTFDELDDLISDPDDMRMHALLIRERILGPMHPDTSYYIRYRGAVYADNGEFERCVVLWMYALDMQQRVFDPLSPMTQSSFLSFAELFSFMMTEKGSRKPLEVAFNDMMVVFEKVVNEAERGKEVVQKSNDGKSNYHRLIVIIMHLLKLLCDIQHRMTEEETFRFKKTAYRLVKLNLRGETSYTVLHFACSKATSHVGRHPVCQYPASGVVELLLDVGADPNVDDDAGNTPLHIAAMERPCFGNIIDTLLQAGAHVDTVNHENKNALQLFPPSTVCGLQCPVNYQSLQCLSAQAIRKHNLSYLDVVCARSVAFVDKH